MQGCLLSSWCILLLSLRGVVHAFPIPQQQRWSLTTTRANYYHHDDNDDGGTVDETAVPSHNRRRRQVVTAVLGALCGWIGASPRYYRAFADDVLLRGTVTVPADYSFQSSAAALYITCRPNRADNVPRAILDGSNGKPPPVLTARLALNETTASTFPLSFALTTRDVTPEGQGLWWLNDNNDNNDASLVVSARLDTDGVAATRSPDDLVGRTISNGQQPVELALTGRGAFGKFATKPQK